MPSYIFSMVQVSLRWLQRILLFVGLLCLLLSSRRFSHTNLFRLSDSAQACSSHSLHAAWALRACTRHEACAGLRQVLEALAEIAFAPQFFPGRIEKERRAVMAEAQMMNSIEYRVDCQLLQFLHQENALGSRFPIGKMDQARRLSGALS